MRRAPVEIPWTVIREAQILAEERKRNNVTATPMIFMTEEGEFIVGTFRPNPTAQSVCNVYPDGSVIRATSGLAFRVGSASRSPTDAPWLTFSIKVDLHAGPDRDEHVRDLVDAANRLGVPLTTTFNEVQLTVFPGADWKTLSEKLLKSVQGEGLPVVG